MFSDMRSLSVFIKLDTEEGSPPARFAETGCGSPMGPSFYISADVPRVSLLASDREIRQIKNAAVARTPASIRAVAQLGRAFASGAKGRRFESCQPDKSPRHSAWGLSGSMRSRPIFHRIHEPNCPYHTRAYRFWCGLFSRCDSDALASLCAHGPRAKVECLQDNRSNGACRDRPCARHRRTRPGDYVIWRGH